MDYINDLIIVLGYFVAALAVVTMLLVEIPKILYHHRMRQRYFPKKPLRHQHDYQIQQINHPEAVDPVTLRTDRGNFDIDRTRQDYFTSLIQESTVDFTDMLTIYQVMSDAIATPNTPQWSLWGTFTYHDQDHRLTIKLKKAKNTDPDEPPYDSGSFPDLESMIKAVKNYIPDAAIGTNFTPVYIIDNPGEPPRTIAFDYYNLYDDPHKKRDFFRKAHSARPLLFLYVWGEQKIPAWSGIR